MLLVVVGQAEEVLSQTCTRASFPCGLGNGVLIDDRLVGIFLLKKDTCTGGQLFFYIFVFFKSDLHCQGFKPGPKRLLWCGCALYTLGLVQSAQE